MLNYTKQERLATDEHSGFLGPFVSYEENELLWINYQVVFTIIQFLCNLQMGPIS